MQKAKALILILLLSLPILLSAQDGSDPEIEHDWDDYIMDLYVKGDQTFMISVGTVFPTVFINHGSIIKHNFSPPVGGMGSLSYSYFLNSNVFTGGEFGGAFLRTIGKNTVYLINFGLKTGYQFVVWRFEFPVSLTLGMTWHRYLNLGYYGLYVKAGGSVFYRGSSRYSFGLTSNWGWYPEWTNEKSKNVHGNIIDLTVSARYHF